VAEGDTHRISVQEHDNARSEIVYGIEKMNGCSRAALSRGSIYPLADINMLSSVPRMPRRAPDATAAPRVCVWLQRI
jgi:hypothetical protein